MRLDKRFVNWGEIKTCSVSRCVFFTLGCCSYWTGVDPSRLPPQHLCLLWGLGPHDPAAILHSLRRWSELPASKYVLSVHFYHGATLQSLSLVSMGPMTGLIHHLLADSAPDTAPDNLMIIFEVCLHLLQISLKGAFGTKCVSEKVINSEWVYLTFWTTRLDWVFLNLPPSIVMQGTDLHLSLAGARRWRQGALDLWLSLAPVKEPLNCSTVELCPPPITLGSAEFTFYHPTDCFLVLLVQIGGFRTCEPSTIVVTKITNSRFAHLC